ncbi:MAG TPA: radical SAM protein [Desulfonatronum sp.]|nr:radical SAM protein [Desulfonatronum sp.]
MKIILIYPPCLEARAHKLHTEDVGVTPIGLHYIGALLMEHGHDVEILNWYDINEDPAKIRDVLKQKKPAIIGFSIVNANRYGGIEIARAAKEILPGVTIVFGGIGTTFLWKHLLKNFKEIDYAVLGEGEYSFLGLVEHLENGDAQGIEKVRGIGHRQGGKIVSTGQAEFIQDLDMLPSPSKYFTFQHLVSARGCPANCAFCGSPKFWKRKVRFHSAGYFVDQLEQLYNKGVKFFYISDDTFTMKKGRIIDICQQIIDRGLKIAWFAISRVNYVDEDMLLWMRKAGCIQISYGVESGSEKIRKSLNKRIDAQDIKRAFDLTVSYGILARAYFIYGSPGENAQTIRETTNLINQIKPLNVIFYILEIFPGTALYDDFKHRMKINDDIWLNRIEHIKYFETDRRLTADMVVTFGQRLRSEYYRRLPEFADSISLVDNKELYESHADFLSRLGMTFSHGDFASLEAIPEKETVAERLYLKSLSFHPNERAYLGLGIIRQKQGRYAESLRELSEGVKKHPDSETLAACLCVSYMNLGKDAQARELARRFPGSPQMLRLGLSS